jgi:hypothetical protein
MPSRHCNDCFTDWPSMGEDYKVCPLCHTFTEYWGGGTALTLTKARMKVSTEKFEKYYEARGPRPLTTRHLEQYIWTVAKTWWQHVIEMIPTQKPAE